MCCSDITNASIITEPSLWTDIANASAITTLILFVFYVIGRIWVIIKSSKLVYEEFDVKFTEKSDHCAIDEYNNFYVIDKTNEILIIKSSEPIMNLKIVPIKFNKSFKDITPKKSKAIFEYDRLLNSNEPLALQIIIPEGRPPKILCKLLNKYFQSDKTQSKSKT